MVYPSFGRFCCTWLFGLTLFSLYLFFCLSTSKIEDLSKKDKSADNFRKAITEYTPDVPVPDGYYDPTATPSGSDYPSKALSVCDGNRESSDAIVLIGQKSHSTYDSSHKTSITEVLRSIEIFYKKAPEADILIWHEGEFSHDDLNFFKLPLNVRLCLLKNRDIWGVNPSNLAYGKALIEKKLWNKWSIGYRNMIRFYSVTMWPALRSLGYKWVMRFDDDSMLLSPIEYNVFGFMRSNEFIYGYRMNSKECGSPVHFESFVESYALLSSIKIGRAHYCDGEGSIGFYNNWFVSEIDWWLKGQVSDFIKAFDESGLIYTHRDNDLVFQTAAVRLLLPLRKRYRFVDYSYRHHTIENGGVVWGGLETGCLDENSGQVFREYLASFFPNRNSILTHHKVECFNQSSNALKGDMIQSSTILSVGSVEAQGLAPCCLGSK